MRAVAMMTWCCAGGQKHCMLAPSLSSGLTSRHHVPWSAILWGQMSSTLWLCLFLPVRSFLSSEEWVLGVTRNWWCAKRPYSFLAPGVTWMNTTFWPVIFFWIEWTCDLIAIHWNIHRWHIDDFQEGTRATVTWGDEAVAFIDSFVGRANWNLHVEVLFWLVGSAHVADDEESS